MKKLIFILIMCILFISPVSALTYDFDAKLQKGSNSSLYEIRLSIKNVKDTEYGVAACQFKLGLSDGIKLNNEIRTVNNWSMFKGGIYVFDTGSPILDSKEFAIIPVKVSKNGTVTISGIECSDGEVITKEDDVKINISYSSSGNSSSNENKPSSGGNIGTTVDKVKDSNCDLSNIILNEGKIEFSPSETDYQIEVNDFDDLEVLPVLASNNAKFNMKKLDKRVVIDVTAEDGTTKVYTISVKEVKNTISKNTKKEKSKFIPIFIVIILLLVIVNAVRVGKKFVKKS